MATTMRMKKNGKTLLEKQSKINTRVKKKKHFVVASSL